MHLSERGIKYIICPGFVFSAYDRQEHYIGPYKLMSLYNVNPRECYIHEPAPWWPKSYYQYSEEEQKGLPRLYPREDGNYNLRRTYGG